MLGGMDETPSRVERLKSVASVLVIGAAVGLLMCLVGFLVLLAIAAGMGL